MTIFVDASALVAIIENEPGRDELAQNLRDATLAYWSAMACWEAVSALQNTYKRPIAIARESVSAFASAFDLHLVMIGQAELTIALDAYQRYGKGRHRAELNFGDCFAYACAKTNDARLLYKGDDFAHTDLA